MDEVVALIKAVCNERLNHPADTTANEVKILAEAVKICNSISNGGDNTINVVMSPELQEYAK